MRKVFGRPEAMADVPMHYCPGCTHGIIHRLIAEVIDELGVREKTVGISPVGCAVLAYDYFNCDFVEASHGRAPAVATGIKRTLPDSVVFCYQGDGDLASIGMAEIVHAATRGEKISVIFVNNAIYGMTGGQMAPTTLPGQRTTTSPRGRDVEGAGHPIRVAELLSTLSGVAYISRVSVTGPTNVIKAKRAVRRAFETQIEGKGFSLVEFLSTCPINWGMSPLEAMKWVDEKMSLYYPLGDYTQVQEVAGNA
jgi:2-oxoglutarate ferredoxin oxidoreductase subunit beta